MTTILFDLKAPQLSGLIGVNAVITVRQMKRKINGDVYIFPRGYKVSTKAGKAEIDIEPTGVETACYINVSTDKNEHLTGAYFIPNKETEQYTKLVSVDPKTLEPDAEPDAAWWAVARATVNSGEVVGDDLFLTRTDGVKIKAGNVRGLPGKDGEDGVDGAPGEDGVDGAPGENGISVVNTEINADGDLLIYLSNDLVVNAGRARGIDGIDGVDGTNGTDGIDGAPGAPGAPGKDGVNGLTIIPSEKPVTDLASSYPEGISFMSIGQSANGWPRGYSMVVTFKNGARVTQNTYSGTGAIVNTRSVSADIWSTFSRYAFTNSTWSAASIDRDVLDPARIQKVSTVADGLMLKEDKAKLDGLVGTVHLSIPKNATDLPDSYVKGLTTFVLSGNQLGFPTTWAQVSTVKGLDGRAVQTIEPISSASIAPTTIFKRFTTALNTWSGFYKIDLVAV